MTETDTAFLTSAGGKEFSGKKLFPFTPQRQAVAAEMGLQWGFTARYKPQSLFRDSIIVVWLCSVTAARVDDAEGDAKAAMRDAYKWAEKQGIGLGTKAFESAHALFFEIVKEVRESRGEPIMPHDPGGDDPGEQ